MGTKDGEYVLTFFAFMRSINTYEIKCYLKQKTGSTITNLGTISNDLDEGGETDDRSSNSMSVIANLKSGDEIYIDVDASGSSYLISSSSDRFISFSGFLLK